MWGGWKAEGEWEGNGKVGGRERKRERAGGRERGRGELPFVSSNEPTVSADKTRFGRQYRLDYDCDFVADSASAREKLYLIPSSENNFETFNFFLSPFLDYHPGSPKVPKPFPS